jgi:predicted AAA+ superfamily ATPase
MFKRILAISSDESFFLFGARGTGKTTLVESLPFLKKALIFDLLDQDLEEEFQLRPQLLFERCAHLPKNSWILIDEVQKIPALLNVVHSLIEKKKLKFALTGSSSRKLKLKGANLLAGRAFMNTLHPLTHAEIGKDFDIDSVLNWGTLPKVINSKSDSLKSKFLKSYVAVYLKEEIVAEQLVRNLTPFRMFLPIAAQMNAKTINFSNIARDTGVDYKTVQTYFDILNETYLGSFLESYSGSVRKVQIQAPKFYFFDLGVKRALQKQLNIPVLPEMNTYGEAFETWFINECRWLNSYFDLDFEFSYLRTKDDVEVDLIITRPDGSQSLIEIKSAKHIAPEHLKHLKLLKSSFPKADFYCVSQVKFVQEIEGIKILPWMKAFKELGLDPS